MVVFLGVTGACLVAVIGICGLWKKHSKAFLKGEIVDGLVFAAKVTQMLMALGIALHFNAGHVGWQAVGAAAFVAITPLLLALAILVERRPIAVNPRRRR